MKGSRASGLPSQMLILNTFTCLHSMLTDLDSSPVETYHHAETCPKDRHIESEASLRDATQSPVKSAIFSKDSHTPLPPPSIFSFNFPSGRMSSHDSCYL